MEVSSPAQRAAVDADRRLCTWMYETRNETAQIDPRPRALVILVLRVGSRDVYRSL